MNFVDFFRWLESLGMLNAFLPFMLVFVIMFAVLEKTGILGPDKKAINVVFSAIAGLIVVIPHVMGRYPAGRDIVVIINTALPNVIGVMVAVILALILIAIATDGSVKSFSSLVSWVPYVALAIVVYIFGAAAGWWHNIFRNFGTQTMSIVLILIVFGLVFYYIVGDNLTPQEKEDRKKKREAEAAAKKTNG
jgi:hypothetical protein